MGNCQGRQKWLRLRVECTKEYATLTVVCFSNLRSPMLETEANSRGAGEQG